MIHDSVLQRNVQLLLPHRVEMMKEKIQKVMNGDPGMNDWCYTRISIHLWITGGAISEWDMKGQGTKLRIYMSESVCQASESYGRLVNINAVTGLSNAKWEQVLVFEDVV